MSSRKNYSRNSNNSKGTFKYVAFWGMLLVGSFMLGFLVISPLVGLATPRAAKQNANDKVATAASQHSPGEVVPMPPKSAIIAKDEGVQITPDKMDEGEVQKPDSSVDSQDNSNEKPVVTKKRSRHADTNNDSTKDAVSDPQTTDEPANTKPARNVDNGDMPVETPKPKRKSSSTRSADTATDEPTPTVRRRPAPSTDDTSSDEPTPKKKKRNSDNTSTEKKRPSNSDSGVQKGEGIDR